MPTNSRDLTETSPRTPELPALSPGQFDELKESIRLRGVLVPILRTAEDGLVLDGRERLKACYELGIRKWPERVIGGLTASERVEYRIRLNCERRHLTREQRRVLLEAVVAAYPSKSTRELADFCRVDPRTVGRAKGKLVSRGAIAPPQGILGRDGKVYKPRPAVSTENKRQSAEAAGLLAEVGDDGRISGGVGLRTLRQIRHERKVLAHASGPASRTPTSIKLYHCDFRDMEKHTGDLTSTIDLALLDPPWGSDWLGNLPELAAMSGRLLRPGGVCAVYCGQANIPVFAQEFGKHLNYIWTVAAINPVSKNGARKDGTIMSRWRPVLLFTKGSATLPRTISDLMDFGELEEQMHPRGWGQPVAEAVRLIETLSTKGSSLVDLTVGAGASAVAVAQVGGGRTFYGCDVSPECVKIARKRVAEAIKSGTQAYRV
jgi:hypothetical protein